MLIFWIMTSLAWLRTVLQSVALAQSTVVIVRASDTQSTSRAAAWLFALSSAFGVVYALWSGAPMVYAFASGVSVILQLAVLAKLHRIAFAVVPTPSPSLDPLPMSAAQRPRDQRGRDIRQTPAPVLAE